MKPPLAAAGELDARLLQLLGEPGIDPRCHEELGIAKIRCNKSPGDAILSDGELIDATVSKIRLEGRVGDTLHLAYAL